MSAAHGYAPVNGFANTPRTGISRKAGTGQQRGNNDGSNSG
jgi:hypothetical protein